MWNLVLGLCFELYFLLLCFYFCTHLTERERERGLLCFISGLNVMLLSEFGIASWFGLWYVNVAIRCRTYLLFRSHRCFPSLFKQSDKIQ